MTDPHEMFEAFVADAIAQSPEPLKELGKFLSEQLDDDAWKTADRLLLQLAALQPSSAADAKPVAWPDDVPLKKGDVFHFYRSRQEAGYEPATVMFSNEEGVLYRGYAGQPRWSPWEPFYDIVIVSRSAQPHPSQQAGPHCQLCGGNVEGWTCQTCEAEFEEVDSLLVLKTEKPSQQADTLDATVSRIKTLANDSQQAGVEGEALVEIVEGLKGSMEHGAWRDEHGVRLKDTPEWAAFYVSVRSGARK